MVREGYKDVGQLHGGIVTYGKDPEVQGELWDGKMYVFDECIAVDINHVDPMLSVRIGSMAHLVNAMLTAVTHSVTVVSLLQRKMKTNTSVAAHMNVVSTHVTVMSLKMV